MGRFVWLYRHLIMRILFIGENILQSKGGIVTVMKQMLGDDVINSSVTYKTIYTTGDEFSFPKKLSGWVLAYLKFLLIIPRYRVVHIHHASNLNFWLTGVFVSLAKCFGKKVLLHNHGADFIEFYNKCSPAGQKRITNIFKKADANIVLSDSWIKWYKNIAPEANWILLPNAIAIPDNVQAKQFDDKEISLLYLARIEERKGFFDMMTIIPDLLKKYPGVRLSIAGQGSTVKVDEIINDPVIGGQIFLLGYINAMQRDHALRKAHILLLPSYEEGMPMALLEAMSYAVVPVTTPVGGIPEVVENSFNGMLNLPGDSEALSKSIEILLNDKNLFYNLSQNAYNIITEKYNFNKYRLRLLAIYELMYK
jgi:glycosyltransferase involved in cell wall biosynthesis